MPDRRGWRLGPGLLALGLILTARGGSRPALARPKGLALAPDGNLYTADRLNSALWTSARGDAFLRRLAEH